jgi:hypothetical protein
MSVSKNRLAIPDQCAIAVVGVLIGMPFVDRLGWYSDDWSVRSAVYFGRPGLFGAFSSLQQFDVAIRPVQFAYIAVATQWLGDRPWPSHALNLALMTTLPILFYNALLLLRTPRAIALVASLAFAVGPNASTDRYWLAVPANLSLAFFFCGIILGELAARTTREVARWWRAALAILCMLACMATYEVCLPLIAAYVAYAAIRRRLAFAGAQSLIVGGFVAHKLLVAPRVHVDIGSSHTASLGKVLEFAIVHLGELIVLLPQDAVAGATFIDSGPLCFLALVVGAICFAYVSLTVDPTPASCVARRAMAAGFILFWLGFAVFFAGGMYFNSTATGAQNRVASAAAIGISLLVAGLCAVLARLPGRSFSRFVLGAGLATYATCSAFVLFAVGTSWCDAARAQERVLAAIRSQIAPVPRVLLISGVCPYIGAGIVFETAGDMSGAVRIAYRDPAVRADVVNVATQVDSTGVRTDFYGHETSYAFGKGFVGFDIRTGVMERLTDRMRAELFVRNGAREYIDYCPAGAANIGVPLMPLDRDLDGANAIDRHNGHDARTFHLRRT